MCDDISDTIYKVINNGEVANGDDNDLLQNVKSLRNACARSPDIQLQIAADDGLGEFLQSLLFGADDVYKRERLRSMAWQLLANIIVSNPATQNIIWGKYGEYITCQCEDVPLSPNADIQLMIYYNVFRGGTGSITESKALFTITKVWQAVISEKSSEKFEFLHFFFEHFLVQDGRNTVRCYAKLEVSERIAFLDYLASYLRHDSPNGLVHNFLLQHVSKEFKIKSDCLLRHSTSKQIDETSSRETHALLRVIASATGSESYNQLYVSDHSLFLNVSSLLRCLVLAGKEPSGNIFTPMNKLEEVALSSEICHDFELEISYELKTLLVRCIANLLYKNKKNQDYCLETQLLPALLECTNMDARNPLMKEWSILAIRNACIGCPEIQQIIAGLTQKGNAENNLLNELNLEMGSLRIQPSKE